MHCCGSLYEGCSGGERSVSISMASFQHSSSRVSTSTVRSFSGAERPRIHNLETDISAISSSGQDQTWADSFTDYQVYQGDRQSIGGYDEDQKYIPGRNQVDWSLGDHIKTGSEVGVVRAVGENYFLSADVSGFEPHEVVVLAYNQCVVIHAEKSGSDVGVSGRFTHKSVLPADMDPLSVSSSLTSDQTLIVSIRRIPKTSSFDLL
nr:uncharacterized protein hspb12 [Danio rerio]|eukprot:XP_003201762.1 uncharacterized protein hspb12 [Danio rerio]